MPSPKRLEVKDPKIIEDGADRASWTRSSINRQTTADDDRVHAAGCLKRAQHLRSQGVIDDRAIAPAD